METSIHELRNILKVYTQEELVDILDYEANRNDLDGIIENIMNDINEKIIEYVDTVR